MTGKARILFVDDEKRVLNAMRGLFRREYELFLANCGADALEVAASNDIDVIVADQRMPGMTGIEVLEKIKLASPRTVRILLTGYADPSAIEGSINIGEVFRFLSKPCPPNQLRDTLKLAIEASHTAPIAEPAAVAAPPARPHTPPPAQPAPGTHETSPPATAEASQTASPPPAAPASPAENDATEPALKVLDDGAARPARPHWDSVTNVVMSGDSSKETRESGEAHISPRMRDVGVVVFTVDSEFAATAIRAVSTERKTIIATTLVKAAEAIHDEQAGVLVTDFTNNKAILQKIIAALKKQLPELITISISEGHDSDDMINLINHGQVFRYLVKPIESSDLRAGINAAVVRHLYLLDNPDAAKRHQVADTPGHSEEVRQLFGTGNMFRRRRQKVGNTAP